MLVMSFLFTCVYLLAGLEMRLKNMVYPVIIAPTHIQELQSVVHDKRGIKFGASVTLTRMEKELKSAQQKYSGLF